MRRFGMAPFIAIATRLLRNVVRIVPIFPDEPGDPRTRWHAFIIGRTGQIGRAVAKYLLEHGRDVTPASRGHRKLGDLEAKPAALGRGAPGKSPTYWPH